MIFPQPSRSVIWESHWSAGGAEERSPPWKRWENVSLKNVEPPPGVAQGNSIHRKLANHPMRVWTDENYNLTPRHDRADPALWTQRNRRKHLYILPCNEIDLKFLCDGVASNRTASIIANPAPTQTLGPLPRRGKYANRGSALLRTSLGLHRPGSNRSGSGKYLTSLCMRSCDIRTLVSAGSSYCPSRNGARARRPITQTGGYKRIASRRTASE